MKGFHDDLVKWLVIGYKNAWNYIGDAASSMTDTTWFSDPMVVSVMEIVQNSINGIAYTIMVIFFYIELMAAVKKEGLSDLSEEFIYKLLIQLGLARVLVHYAPVIIEEIVNITNYWIAQIPTAVVDDRFLSGLEATLSETIPLQGGNIFTSILLVIGQLLFAFLCSLPLIVSYVVLIVVSALAYTRNIEILILITASPIPFCFMPYSGTHDIPKKFILAFAAVCLQGVFMMIIYAIFTALIAISSSVLNLIVLFVVLGVSMAKAGSWAKESLGLG